MTFEVIKKTLELAQSQLKNWNKKERRTGTYAACKYDEFSTTILKQWMDIVKIPNQCPVNEIHSTIIYSRKPIDSKYQITMDSVLLKSLGWRFSPSEFAIFGDGTERVLVLKLNAPELINYHETMIRIGATHDHENYVPHVTLSYDLPKDFDWEILEVPPIYFLPTSIYFEPLDLDWKE